MEDKKNHWTKKKLEEAKKKINKEKSKRYRQASMHFKLDDLAIFINSSITRLIIFYQFSFYINLYRYLYKFYNL